MKGSKIRLPWWGRIFSGLARFFRDLRGLHIAGSRWYNSMGWAPGFRPGRLEAPSQAMAA